MISILRFIVYSLNKFALSHGNDIPILPVCIVSIFVLANIYTIHDVYTIMFLKAHPEINGFWIASGCLGIVLFCYYSLYKGEAARLAFAKFEAGDYSRILPLLSILYAIGSLVISLYTGSLVRDMN